MGEQLIQQFFVLKISTIQIYLLWFLLGSFTVATLSDIRRLSAQKEFLEIWALFVLAMFATDFYYNDYLVQIPVYLVLKWGLILIFIPLYFHFYHKVAWGDVSAKMAACSLLPPFFIIIFIVLIRIVEWATKRFWLKYRKGRFYPFMPIIFFSTLMLIIVAVYIF